MMAQAPHANAARLFLNWLLSREGQVVYRKASENDSRCIDIPKRGGIIDPDEVLEAARIFFYSLEENDKTQGNEEFKRFLNEIMPRNEDSGTARLPNDVEAQRRAMIFLTVRWSPLLAGAIMSNCCVYMLERHERSGCCFFLVFAPWRPG
jgi:hypothetical protein